MEMNGTLADAGEYTIDRNGELYLWAGGRSINEDISHFRFINVSIRSRGKLMLIDLPGLQRITLNMTRLVINAGGLLDANDVRIVTVNATIDMAGGFQRQYNILFCKRF